MNGWNNEGSVREGKNGVKAIRENDTRENQQNKLATYRESRAKGKEHKTISYLFPISSNIEFRVSFSSNKAMVSNLTLLSG